MCRSTNYYFRGEKVIDPFTITASHNSLGGHVAFSDKVNDNKKPMPMAFVRNNKHRMNKLKLEDIPEDKELRIDHNNYVDSDSDADADVDVNPELEEELEMDLEVLRQTFDMGIWVVCIGLGFMFSRAKFRPLTVS